MNLFVLFLSISVVVDSLVIKLKPGKLNLHQFGVKSVECFTGS